ncbi:hypothetical protein [Streptomyces sp. NPDC048256]|uniref:hypothetical protein n=1 Tax=Streptomyces sp. NPDC048256 TaxID=3154613 RepID=UPI0033F2787F
MHSLIAVEIVLSDRIPEAGKKPLHGRIKQGAVAHGQTTHAVMPPAMAEPEELYRRVLEEMGELSAGWHPRRDIAGRRSAPPGQLAPGGGPHCRALPSHGRRGLATRYEEDRHVYRAGLLIAAIFLWSARCKNSRLMAGDALPADRSRRVHAREPARRRTRTLPGRRRARGLGDVEINDIDYLDLDYMTPTR